MSGFEIAFVSAIVAAFAVFALVLAWGAARTGKAPPTIKPAE